MTGKAQGVSIAEVLLGQGASGLKDKSALLNARSEEREKNTVGEGPQFGLQGSRPGEKVSAARLVARLLPAIPALVKCKGGKVRTMMVNILDILDTNESRVLF